MHSGLALARSVKEISTGAAAIAITAALALGWYGARWWIAEHDEMSARARLANAGRWMWARRRGLVVMVILGVVLVTLCFHGKGRN